MRGVVVTVGVACALTACVLGLGFGALAAGLEPPTRGERVAARTVGWLLRYRLVESTLHVNGSRALHGSCLQGWMKAANGAPWRGTVLALDDGRTIVQAKPPLRVLGSAKREPATLPLIQLELGGCPRILAPRIGAALQSGTSLHVVNRSFDGKPALAFRVHDTRTTITVIVATHTYRPLAIEARSSRFHGRSRIRLARLTPERLHAILERAS